MWDNRSELVALKLIFKNYSETILLPDGTDYIVSKTHWDILCCALKDMNVSCIM